ncbi:MAG TPA: fluoride efflux transporter CrcB [Flavobacteriaceae bacterium]|nr:fluoride efflux transporter CrcB [Flavobacteriaceae bacterium]
MIRILLLVGFGGFLGSIGRYLTGLLFYRIWPINFPIGTFIANTLGCLLIGCIFGISERMEWFSPEWRLFFATGFCGGYTTFSSFSFENLKMLQAGQYGDFGVYAISSIALGMLAVFVGMLLIRI